jgi:hypothetical protein
VVRATAGG